jgi:hypothetical protein
MELGGLAQNQRALTSDGERFELVGGANAAYPWVWQSVGEQAELEHGPNAAYPSKESRRTGLSFLKGALMLPIL